MLLVDPVSRGPELTSLAITDQQPGLGGRAEARLRSNSYLALKNISCEARGRLLILRGCLPSYYLKQVAQAVVAQIDGVERIDNLIEVLGACFPAAVRATIAACNVCPNLPLTWRCWRHRQPWAGLARQVARLTLCLRELIKKIAHSIWHVLCDRPSQRRG